jgi:hypothetical protein
MVKGRKEDGAIVVQGCNYLLAKNKGMFVIDAATTALFLLIATFGDE